MDLKIFKQKKAFKKHDVYLRPDLYWQLAIILVFVFGILSFAFGYYMFMKVNEEIYTSNQGENIKKIVDKDRLTQALEYFENRKKKSFEILQTPPTVVDPAI